MNKQELRKLFRQKRSQIDDKSGKDKKIAEILLNTTEIKLSDNVLIYVSYGSEIDTKMIISKLLDMKKNIAVPRCLDDGIMEFIYINSLKDLEKGKYGILEPMGNNKFILTEKTVCIVPALSFAENGFRLGYGGGYYDRFLSVNKNICTIGLCYESLISDKIPSEKHDMKVHKIITEERTVHCSAKG